MKAVVLLRESTTPFLTVIHHISYYFPLQDGFYLVLIRTSLLQAFPALDKSMFLHFYTVAETILLKLIRLFQIGELSLAPELDTVKN